MRFPTFHNERELAAQGYLTIGVDEVGCGCLAGPVVAAAVHLPLHSRMANIKDSKLLRPAAREKLFEEFLKRGITFSLGIATVQEVDAINVRQASLLAMWRALTGFLENLEKSKKPFALIDAWHVPYIKIPQRGIIHGDRLVKSIAAASIIAKVARDRLMHEYERDFPGYGLAQHKGYATAVHRRALTQLGPSSLHRRSFLKKIQLWADA
ncbi:MAG: ribonuclease HII [Patescibacteria group bacterium]